MPAERADESVDSLIAAGATSVASTLVDTRAELARVAAVAPAESSSPKAA